MASKNPRPKEERPRCCPKCGAPMCEEWSRELDENLESIAYQVCSANPKDCLIKELENRVAELTRELEEATQVEDEFYAMQAQLRASEAHERELRGKLEEAKRDGDKLSKEVARLCSELNKSDAAVEEAWHEVAKEKSRADDHAGTIINLEGKLDAALDQVRETAEAVVVLRKALEFFRDEVDCLDHAEEVRAGSAAINALKATSAVASATKTAQQRVEAIRREAVEKAWERFSNLERQQKEAGIVYTYEEAVEAARAAILGSQTEKEG